MIKPRLTPWLTALLTVSLLAGFMGLGALPASTGIPWRFDPLISSIVAGALCFVWLAIWIRALFLFRWRGVWLFAVSPGAIFLIAGVWMWNYALDQCRQGLRTDCQMNRSDNNP